MEFKQTAELKDAFGLVQLFSPMVLCWRFFSSFSPLSGKPAGECGGEAAAQDFVASLKKVYKIYLILIFCLASETKSL